MARSCPQLSYHPGGGPSLVCLLRRNCSDCFQILFSEEVVANGSCRFGTSVEGVNPGPSYIAILNQRPPPPPQILLHCCTVPRALEQILFIVLYSLLPRGFEYYLKRLLTSKSLFPALTSSLSFRLNFPTVYWATLFGRPIIITNLPFTKLNSCIYNLPKYFLPHFSK